MPPATMRAFKTSLERGTFDRAYLLHGDDDFLKDEGVRALTERATDTATRDFNLEVHRASDLDAGALQLALDALPMMADRRVVVVRDVPALRKDVRAALERYLERPGVETVVVLVAPAGAAMDEALAAKTTTVEFRALTEDELGTWIVRRASALGSEITEGAVALLLAATAGDLRQIVGELSKLRDFAAGATIDEAAVTAVAGVRRGETLADLLDRVATRDGPGAAALVEQVLAQPKTTGVSIVMALATQMLAMGWAVEARGRGLPAHRLSGELFGLLKENRSSVVGRPWGDAVRAWTGGLRHWDGLSIDRAIRLLLACDASLKETRVSSDEQIIRSLLLGMCAATSSRAA